MRSTGLLKDRPDLFEGCSETKISSTFFAKREDAALRQQSKLEDAHGHRHNSARTTNMVEEKPARSCALDILGSGRVHVFALCDFADHPVDLAIVL
jgi:hypothetical protein